MTINTLHWLSICQQIRLAKLERSSGIVSRILVKCLFQEEVSRDKIRSHTTFGFFGSLAGNQFGFSFICRVCFSVFMSSFFFIAFSFIFIFFLVCQFDWPHFAARLVRVCLLCIRIVRCFIIGIFQPFFASLMCGMRRYIRQVVWQPFWHTNTLALTRTHVHIVCACNFRLHWNHVDVA